MTLGLERLLLIIDADAKGAIAGINATGTAAGGMGTKVAAQSKTASAGMVAVGTAGLIAGGLAAKGLSEAVDSVDAVSREVLKVQRVTGESAEGASKLRFEAQQSGVSIDKLATGLGILSSKGVKLDELGIGLKKADGAARPFNDVLGDIAERIASLPAGQERVDLARQLFGRGGADLLPLLSRGREGLEALQKAAEDFGVVLSQDTLDNVKRNIVATREWQATWEGLKLEVGNEVLPAVTSVAEGAAKVGKAITDIPGLGSLVTDVAVAGAGLGIVGGGATLLAASAAKVKTTWAQLPSVIGATAVAETEDTAAKLANAEASNVAAAAATRYAAAERAAAGAAATSGEAATAAGAAKASGGLGGLTKGLGGVALAVGIATIVADTGSDIVNSVHSTDDKIADAYAHLAETSAKGGRDAVKAFNDAVRAEGDKTSGADILARAALGIPGLSLGGAQFNLGSLVSGRTSGNAEKVFKNELSTQGPEAARKLVDSLKAVNDEQDHTSDSYKQTNAVLKEWSRQVDDASAAQKINTDVTEDQADKVDRLGHVYDDSKSKLANWAEGFGAAIGTVQSALSATQAVSDAQRKLSEDDAKIAKLRGESGESASVLASASDKVSSAHRGEAEASAQLAATGRDLAAAKAELARVDKASDPARYAAAERAVADATDARQAATEGLAGAQGQAASAQRDLSSAQSAAVSTANDLANAEERIASASRSQAAARRELNNANRDLAEKQAELARVNPARDPNRFRQLSGEVADLQDSQLNAQDRVAEANASKAQSERDLTEIRSQAKAKTDELAQAERDRAADSDALILAIANEKIAQVELFEYIKANPNVIPDLTAYIKEWADKAGGDAPAAAQQFIDKLNGIAFSAGIASGEVKTLTDLITGEQWKNYGGGELRSSVTPPTTSSSGGAGGKSIPSAGPDGTLTPNAGYKIGLGDYTLDMNGKSTSDNKGRPWHWDANRQLWIPEFANGGMIGGLGNTDSELIKAMPGEFVMRKGAVNKYGPDFMQMVNSEALPKYANGGFVGAVPGFGSPSDSSGTARLEALMAEAVALLGRVGDLHVHLDQRGYERPPAPADTARGVRSGLYLAGR